ncbi:MAG TPA: hypothetical protein VES42_28545, partial [Pilimelia sp.]|nr:hypothetical protein [Pilimelia sp.]
MASPLARWLATLDEGHLAEILRRRPEALAAPAPTDLAELADRLQQRGPVTAALAGLPLPAIQLIEVIQAFGAAAADRRLVGRTVGRPSDDPDLAATLHVLAQRALVWPDGDALRMAGPLWSAFAHPLGLGAPAAQLLDRVPVVELRRIAAALGLRAAVDRGTTAAAVVARLGDADHVTALLAAAPPDTRELLADAA